VGSLNDEVQNEISQTIKKKGVLQEIANALSDDDRKDFIEALHDKTISSRALAVVLKRRGFIVSNSLILSYRRGGLAYEVR
jgi:tRNA U54 and U55 pseudouridine synthase Pus10